MIKKFEGETRNGMEVMREQNQQGYAFLRLLREPFYFQWC